RHAGAPASLDGDRQEIGRAGRDGEAAHARLLFRVEDFGAAVHLTSRGVGAAPVARAAVMLADGSRVQPTRELTGALVRLVDLGAAVRGRGGVGGWAGPPHGPEAPPAPWGAALAEDKAG